jgi:hypothetical protein
MDSDELIMNDKIIAIKKIYYDEYQLEKIKRLMFDVKEHRCAMEFWHDEVLALENLFKLNRSYEKKILPLLNLVIYLNMEKCLFQFSKV